MVHRQPTLASAIFSLRAGRPDLKDVKVNTRKRKTPQEILMCHPAESLRTNERNPLPDMFNLAQNLPLREKRRCQRLRQQRVVQQCRVVMHQPSNEALGVIKNSFNRLQVRRIRPQADEKDAVRLQEWIARRVMNRRDVKKEDAVIRLIFPWMTLKAHIHLRHKGLAKDEPISRRHHSAKHTRVHRGNIPLARYCHSCARPRHRSGVSIQHLERLLTRGPAALVKHVATVRVGLIEKNSSPPWYLPHQLAVAQSRRIVRLAK